jgi:hypothetical protein
MKADLTFPLLLGQTEVWLHAKDDFVFQIICVKVSQKYSFDKNQSGAL